MASYLQGGGNSALGQTKFKPKYLRESNKAFTDLTARATDDGWIEFRKDKPRINPATFFETYGSALGFNQHYRMKLVKDKADVKQNQHQKYQLFVKNIRVEGAEFGLHFRDGALTLAHGRLPDGLDLDISKPIQERVALEVALADQKLTLDAFKGSEKLPKGELVFTSTTDEMVSEAFRLAYVFEVNLHRIYVDATAGNILKKIPLTQNCINHNHAGEGAVAFGHRGGQTIVSQSKNIATTLVGGTFTHLSGRYSGGQQQKSFEIDPDPMGFRLTAGTPGNAVALETRFDQNNDNATNATNPATGQLVTIATNLDFNDPIVTNPSDSWGTNNQEAATAHWGVYL